MKIKGAVLWRLLLYKNTGGIKLDLNPYYGQIITAGAALSGAVFGWLGSLFTAMVNAKNQKALEERKRIWAVEDKMKAEFEEKVSKRFRVYNEILRTDGENELITFETGLEHPEVFHIKQYRKTVRPVIYENFHVLCDDVRKIVRELDREIEGILFEESLSGGYPVSSEKAVNLYVSLLKIVEGQYKSNNY
ncbi:hypothetical protein [Tumebacillus flagellatus]|uniref:Uncharacterized protein n=1 Tax=Tumebacillus flagellatus TaxID=1157490 RepID=A0A074M5L6_9BACL|nr:hypothetical protein [Tumebacillus flagellatus]KEO81292.1 hypothetical protein EL26_21705 [Tumebacillus flagellatus]